MRFTLALFLFPAALLSAQQNAPSPRTVILPHHDYLRFLHPDAQAAAGFDAKPLSSLLGSVANQTFGPVASDVNALNEIDRVWISVGDSGPSGAVALLMGRFEHGAVTKVLDRALVDHVFLGGPQVLLVGSRAAVESALQRLNTAPPRKLGWVAKQAWELAPGHDLWVVMEPRAELRKMADSLNGIRQFWLGAQFHDEMSLDGEIVAASETLVEKIVGELESAKVRMRGPDPAAAPAEAPAEAPTDFTIERAGSEVYFSAKTGEISTEQINREAARQFGSLFPAVSARAIVPAPVPAVADEKMHAIRKGMTSAEVVSLVGRPLGVSSISGLETPRETWTYQMTSGKKTTLRLDNGVVTAGSIF